MISAVEAAERAAVDNATVPGIVGAVDLVNPCNGYVESSPSTDGDLSADDVSDLGNSLSVLLNDPRNKVPCLVRDKVMDCYFKMQKLVMSVSAGRARAEGQVLELRRQLEVVRDHPVRSGGEGLVERSPTFADVVVRSRAVPPSPPVSPAASTVEGGRQEHVLHLRLTAPSASPARDIATLLKSTFNPADIGVGPVTFKPSRAGLTVTSKVGAYLDNLEQAIVSTPVTRTALEVRKPIRRLPQLKISGVDSTIVPAMLLNQINAQNNLSISVEEFRHRTVFTERYGTKAHIVEVSPRVFSALKEKGKLHIGWTSSVLSENLYVPMSFKCSSLGHATVRCQASQAICNNCAGEHDTSVCTLAEHASYVCNECRRWRRPHNHFFGASTCASVSAWVGRLRVRTDYGGSRPVSLSSN